MRINEIQWWIAENYKDNVLLILDENYSMKNLVASAKQELFDYNNYIKKYKNYLGEKRRESVIPKLEYLQYENFEPFYGIEAERTVCISEETGLTQEVIENSWDKIKKATI